MRKNREVAETKKPNLRYRNTENNHIKSVVIFIPNINHSLEVLITSCSLPYFKRAENRVMPKRCFAVFSCSFG